MADVDLFGIYFSLIFDEAAMATTVNFHSSAPDHGHKLLEPRLANYHAVRRSPTGHKRTSGARAFNVCFRGLSGRHGTPLRMSAYSHKRTFSLYPVHVSRHPNRPSPASHRPAWRPLMQRPRRARGSGPVLPRSPHVGSDHRRFGRIRSGPPSRPRWTPAAIGPTMHP